MRAIDARTTHRVTINSSVDPPARPHELQEAFSCSWSATAAWLLTTLAASSNSSGLYVLLKRISTCNRVERSQDHSLTVPATCVAIAYVSTALPGSSAKQCYDDRVLNML
jgi:hypothetical protein